MIIIPKRVLPESGRTWPQPQEEWNSAQSLRTAFDGWGPRI